MNFGSDTTAPAHPAVLEALARANSGYQPSYGDDDIMARVRILLERIFETTDLDFWLVASGTAANALALSCFVFSITAYPSVTIASSSFINPSPLSLIHI